MSGHNFTQWVILLDTETCRWALPVFSESEYFTTNTDITWNMSIWQTRDLQILRFHTLHTSRSHKLDQESLPVGKSPHHICIPHISRHPCFWLNNWSNKLYRKSPHISLSEPRNATSLRVTNIVEVNYQHPANSGPRLWRWLVCECDLYGRYMVLICEYICS